MIINDQTNKKQKTLRSLKQGDCIKWDGDFFLVLAGADIFKISKDRLYVIELKYSQITWFDLTREYDFEVVNAELTLT